MNSRMALPKLCICLLSLACAAAPALALDRKDVIGFWSLEMQEGAVNLWMETWFDANGTYEVRAHSEVLGETGDMHGKGSWTVRGDYLIAYQTGPCVENFGADHVPCELEAGDDGIDTLRLSGAGDARVLTVRDKDGETEVGGYVGPNRGFTLPDLLTPTALAKPRNGSGRGLERSARAPVATARRGIDIFDMRGRQVR